jgi:hypothetical protein
MEVIPEVTGPVFVAQDPTAPVTVQIGTPVGANDPMIPVMVAVKVVIVPVPVVDCRWVTLRVGVPFGTTTLIKVESTAL